MTSTFGGLKGTWRLSVITTANHATPIANDAAALERELRRVDAQTIVGRWAADIGPL